MSINKRSMTPSSNNNPIGNMFRQSTPQARIKPKKTKDDHINISKSLQQKH